MSSSYSRSSAQRAAPNGGSPFDLDSDDMLEPLTVDVNVDGALLQTLSLDPSKRKSRDNLPISTTFLQAMLVFLYAVYVWLPEHNPILPPWFSYLPSKILFHAVLYALISVITLCIFYRHRRSRRRGFLKFYRKINHLRRIPFFTLSIGNALSMPLWALSTSAGAKEAGSFEHQADLLLRLIVSAEAAIILPCCIGYICRVRDYNSSTPIPDYEQLLVGGSRAGSSVHRDGDGGASLKIGSRRSHATGDDKFNTDDPHVVVRYQADMIKFLEVKVKDLKTQLLALSEDAAPRHQTDHSMSAQKRGSQYHQRTMRDEDVLQLVKERDELRNIVAKQNGSGGVDPKQLKEKIRLQQQLKEANRNLKRLEAELNIERESHRAAQAFLEQYQRDGNTSSSAIED